MERTKTETIKERMVYVYLPSEGLADEWRRHAALTKVKDERKKVDEESREI